MPGPGGVRGARGASPRLGAMQGLGSAPGTAHPALPGAWRVSCNPQSYVNKTFSGVFERAESLLPHCTSSQPRALPWAPSPAHSAGRLLPGQSAEQGRASLRCRGPAEQAEAGRRRRKGRDGCRALMGTCTRVSSLQRGGEGWPEGCHAEALTRREGVTSGAGEAGAGESRRCRQGPLLSLRYYAKCLLGD